MFKVKNFVLFSMLIMAGCVSMPACIEGDCFSGFGKMTTYTQTYTGEFKNGQPHGYGTMIWHGADSGEKYVGDFVEGWRTGFGTYTWKSGNVYEGEFLNNKLNGEGSLYYTDGSSYVGQYKDNQRHGLGTYTTNSFVYQGEWREGEGNGEGTLTNSSGDTYEGSFKDSKKHGIGVMKFSDGRVQEGRWINGLFTGSKAIAKKAPPKPDDNKIVKASSGTGFSVSSKGHILTNYHVIEGCSSVTVSHEGKNISTEILFYDGFNDLALLKSNIPSSKFLPIESKNPQLMQEVFVAGFPFGDAISSSLKITKGIISSLTGIGNNYSNIQIDAAMQPGNSGGPIFNEKGNVLGVAVAKLDFEKVLENFGTIPEDTNFGIKANIITNFLESNNVRGLPKPNETKISMSQLGGKITQATYPISCMMTMAQIRDIQSRKVIYTNLVE